VDDGLTWTSKVTGSVDDFSEVHWNETLGRFYIQETGSGTYTNDSRLHMSSDGVTFTYSVLAFDNYNVKLSLPPSGMTAVFAVGRYQASGYYIKKSTDGGDTWSIWHIDSQLFDDALPLAVWQRDGFVWVVWNDAPSINYYSITKHDVDAAIYAAPIETRSFADNGTSPNTIPQPIHSVQSGPGGDYYMANGYKIEKDGFTITAASASLFSGYTVSHQYFKSTPDGIIASPLTNDTTTLFPPLVNVPCAGSVTRYNEGAANQYVRIK
jgi:hypothetical protein